MWEWVRRAPIKRAEIQSAAERFVRDAPEGMAYVHACDAYAQTSPGSPEHARAAGIKLQLRRLVRPGADTATRMAQDSGLI